MCLQREQRISKKITVFFFVLCLGKKIAKDYIGDGLLLLAGTLLATKDLLLREDVVPPHLDHQRAFLLCARASGDTFSNDDTFRTGTQVILCWSKGAA